MAPEGDEIVEEVEMLPMKGEHYPDLRGGRIPWTDDVERLNQLLQD